MNIKSDIHKVLVVGLGSRTGLEASNFLTGKGYEVAVSDIKDLTELQDILSRIDKRVKLYMENQKPELLEYGFDLIVLSPGVPKSIPLICEAYRRGIPVISEIELAYYFNRGRVIAITGTDGKSTTTSLTGHILKSIGLDTYVGGNIGVPFVTFVNSVKDNSISVLELSSFQLETIDKFRPDVSSILNVAPDHLDRYENMDEYFNAKLRIAMNQDADDYFVYNHDDITIAKGLGGIRAKKLRFSLYDDTADAYFKDGYIFIRIKNSEIKFIETSKLKLMGIHNIQNIMAALLMVLSLINKTGEKTDSRLIAQACYTFKGLPHRMEEIGVFQGRTFINDSKATTINAVEMALKSMDRRTVLILGGRTKGDDYQRLVHSLVPEVRALILIGESKVDFAEIFKDYKHVLADTLEEAVASAMRISQEGDAILLSPACASFDMFKNYEHRGDKFKEAYRKLSEGELAWTTNP